MLVAGLGKKLKNDCLRLTPDTSEQTQKYQDQDEGDEEILYLYRILIYHFVINHL